MAKLEIIQSGDSAIFCKLGDTINEDLAEKIASFNSSISSMPGSGIIETVPAYLGIMVYFNPLKTEINTLVEKIREIYSKPDDSITADQGTVHFIPVCYGEDFGPDLGHVASHNSITDTEVISIHSAGSYRVYMLGFTPGFPYLGGMDHRIATPRKSTPSLGIKAGSVGIAGEQTGIYPVTSPGGWQIIGRTPLVLFNPADNSRPFLFRAGDVLNFYPVDRSTFDIITSRLRSERFDTSEKFIA